MGSINDWLSKLGDVKPIVDDASDSASSTSLPGSSRPAINLPRELWEDVDRHIRSDSVSLLESCLNEALEYERKQSGSYQKFLLHLLQRAISVQAKECITMLLCKVDSLEDEDDIHLRNCIHRLVIAIGRAKSSQAIIEDGDSLQRQPNGNSIVPAEAPNLQGTSYASKEQDFLAEEEQLDASVKLLDLLLGKLTKTQRGALATRDNFGCYPLHYAAQYGLVTVCKVITAYMTEWDQFEMTHGIDSIEWHDQDGHSPLHLSVIGGYAAATKCLLDTCQPKQLASSGVAGAARLISDSSDLLMMATRANFIKIVKMLVKAGANINQKDSHGETALHAAARFGHAECAKALLDVGESRIVDLEIPETTFGWTPLLVACVDGHEELVKILLESGADGHRKDSSGWTAKEHAALRGHMAITSLLGRYCEPRQTPGEAIKNVQPNAGWKAPSLEDRSSNAGKESGSVRAPAPVKSFGHRYLTNESMVLVSLGSLDQRKDVKPVKLDNIPIADAHATQLDTALSLVVSANGASGNPTIIDLPVQENISTHPIAFTTKDITKVKIMFDMVPTYAGSKDRVVGRGVALLSSVKPALGSKRMNLQGDVSVPIVAAKTLDFIGSVNFSFIVITPFTHPNMSINETSTYWKTLTSPMVIGHRGLGKNMASRKSLQLGENTLQSFIAAANLGASYVEFDVQLTKDHVPVIYHDFLVSETGIDAPVHALTLEQFLHVNETHNTRRSRPDSVSRDPSPNGMDGATNTHPRMQQRAHSLGATTSPAFMNMPDRMKHTRDYKIKGFKGNSRGNFIQAPFTTLEEILRKLPQHIGFNIEMKYPMLFESEEQEMDTYAVELNSFVDTVLQKVYDLGSDRDVIFSSFNPDICLLLSFKQPSIPVMFLTDAGTSPVGDIRASSLQEAIRFASRWNLLGVVSAAEPLVACPRLVKVVKESGLVCVSYGTLNNDSGNVRVCFHN